jgi:hypothetical protein
VYGRSQQVPVPSHGGLVALTAVAQSWACPDRFKPTVIQTINSLGRTLRNASNNNAPPPQLYPSTAKLLSPKSGRSHREGVRSLAADRGGVQSCCQPTSHVHVRATIWITSLILSFLWSLGSTRTPSPKCSSACLTDRFLHLSAPSKSGPGDVLPQLLQLSRTLGWSSVQISLQDFSLRYPEAG